MLERPERHSLFGCSPECCRWPALSHMQNCSRCDPKMLVSTESSATVTALSGMIPYSPASLGRVRNHPRRLRPCLGIHLWVDPVSTRALCISSRVSCWVCDLSQRFSERIQSLTFNGLFLFHHSLHRSRRPVWSATSRGTRSHRHNDFDQLCGSQGQWKLRDSNDDYQSLSTDPRWGRRVCLQRWGLESSFRG